MSDANFQESVFEAVHEAAGYLPAGYPERERERERWRATLVGAETAEMLRDRLMVLWEHVPGDRERLDAAWRAIVPILRSDWRLARDLVLLGLASAPLTGEQVRRRRRALGLSQDALARTLGTLQQTIARWENGATIERPAELDLALEALERRATEEPRP